MGKVGILTILVVAVLLLAMPLTAALDGPLGDDGGVRGDTRGSWTVKHFEEHNVPVGVSFEESRENSTYHVPIPNSGTVTAASISLKGVERYSLKGTPTDFGDLPTASHIAFRGEDGKYPPLNSPSNYNQFRFTSTEEVDISSLDAQCVTQSTSQSLNPLPFHYPYHMFDMQVDRAGMVRLVLQWHGYGHNPENKTLTHGAEMYVWNYTDSSWLLVGSYESNDTLGQVRKIGHTLMSPYDYADNFGHVNILVFGKHDERGPMRPDQGWVATDYVSATVLRNDTLQQPQDVSLSIGAGSPIWSVSGPWTGSVTVDDSHGLKAALQAYVDSIPPSPQSVSAPIVLKVRQATWGMVGVSALSVTVREVNNQPPEFLGADDIEIDEDTDLTRALDLALSFDDDYNGNDLTYSVEYEENASAVHAEVHTDGHHVNLITVADDWAGELVFRFSATDVWGLTSETDDITVTVNQVNDAPVLDDPGDLFLEEDEPFVLNLTVLEPDLPYGDDLTFSDDTDLFDVDATTGQIAFTPVQADVGRYNVTVTVRDEEGASDSVTFGVTVVGINDRPSIQDPGVLVAYEGVLFSYNFTAIDEDGDTAFNWMLAGGVGTMFMGQQNGRLTWVPEGEHVGTVNVSIIVRDRQGASDQINVTFEVVNTNDPPVLDELRLAQLTEGELFEYIVGFTDPDIEEDPSETHTFRVDPPLFEILPGGVIDFTPSNDHVGTHHVNLTVTDAGGLSHTLPWELEVTNVNQPPTLDPIEEQFWREDGAVFLVITASDPDVDDVLTFSDTTSMFDIDPLTGEINFTPAQSMVGKHQVRIQVKDRAGLYADVYFDVTIGAHNDAPVIAIRVETVKDHLMEGDMLSLAAEAEDEDNRRIDLHYIWYLDGTEKGEGDTIVLKNLKPGRHTVELRVTDGDNTVSATYDFEVEAEEERFPWGLLVTAIVVIAVATIAGLVLFERRRGKGGLEPLEERPEPVEPEPEPVYEENPFKDWH